MRPEDVKLLLDIYAKSRQNAVRDDLCGNYFAAGRGDPYGNYFAAERDDPHGNYYAAESDDPHGNYFTGQMWEQQGQMAHFLLFEQSLASSTNVIETGRKLVEMARDFSAKRKNSIIKFKEIWMVKKPVEQKIPITILRDPSVSHQETKVSWKTQDKTALSGTHYVGCGGEITFNQGDTSKEIEIEILNFNEEADDLRFTVELNHGVYDPNPITISLMKIDSAEKNMLDKFSSLFTIPDIKFLLDGCLNARTFHMALAYLCSTTRDIDAQIALACELSFLCLRKSSGVAMRKDSIVNIFTSFFRRDEYNF